MPVVFLKRFKRSCLDCFQGVASTTASEDREDELWTHCASGVQCFEYRIISPPERMLRHSQAEDVGTPRIIASLCAEDVKTFVTILGLRGIGVEVSKDTIIPRTLPGNSSVGVAVEKTPDAPECLHRLVSWLPGLKDTTPWTSLMLHLQGEGRALPLMSAKA